MTAPVNQDGPGAASPAPGPPASMQRVVEFDVTDDGPIERTTFVPAPDEKDCTCNGQWTCCFCTGCAGCSECEAGPDGEVAP